MLERRFGLIKRWSRRIVWTCAWITFAFLASLTPFLFTTTSGPGPSKFHPWNEFGCKGYWLSITRNSSDVFVCLSDCGKFYAIAQPQLIADRPQWDLLISSFGNQSTFSILKGLSIIPEALKISDDQRLISIKSSRYGNRATWYIRDAKGQIEKQSASSCSIEFAHDTSCIATVGGSGGYCGPIANFNPSRYVHNTHNKVVRHIFFDAEDKPLVLIDDDMEAHGAIELWAIDMGQRLWRIEKIDRYVEPFTFSSAITAVMHSGDKSHLHLYSMVDGRKLRTLSWPSDKWLSLMKPYHSLNGKYFLHPTIRQGLSEKLPSLSHFPWLDRQVHAVEAAIPAIAEAICWQLTDLDSNDGALEITRTAGQSSLDLVRQTACFHADAPILTTIQDDGLYDWDLPPRMRWFTPWAWPSLAATLVLGWFIWPRTSRISGESTSIPPLQ
ncbi:hypothetical protein BH10PLA2_BH10PLA2_19200 [soil metagenome]